MELIIAVAVIYLLIKVFAGTSKRPPTDAPPQYRNPSSRPDTTTPLSPRTAASSTYQPRMRPSDAAVYTHVAGAPYRIGKTTRIDTVFHLGQSLRVERERGNQHDSNAIKLIIGSQHVGYIPQAVNRPLAQHLDDGGSLSVRVTQVNADDCWKGVRIMVTQH
jgi:hypothetical protein